MKNKVTLPLEELNNLKHRSKTISAGRMSFVCPLCDHKNTYNSMDFPKRGVQSLVIYCDGEEGGCDKEIVIKKHVKQDFVITVHKIATEENK